MINFSDTKDEVVKIVTDRTAAAMCKLLSGIVENDEKLSIAVFGTLEDKIREELKNPENYKQINSEISESTEILIKLIRNAFKNVENSLPNGDGDSLKKKFRVALDNDFREENIRKRIENIIEIVSSIEPDVAEQPEKVAEQPEVVAEVVAEQPEVVAEQPEVNTDDIRVNIDKPPVNSQNPEIINESTKKGGSKRRTSKRSTSKSKTKTRRNAKTNKRKRTRSSTKPRRKTLKRSGRRVIRR
jgi:hypothetical protein